MNFLEKKYLEFVLNDIIDEKKTKAIKLYAILTMLDGVVKKIEIIDTDILIQRNIKKAHPLILKNRLVQAKKYFHNFFIEEVKKYKKDHSYYELEKMYIIDYLNKNKQKNFFIEDILMIIKADNEISQEEREFLHQIGVS